jgi:hypothetical protein
MGRYIGFYKPRSYKFTNKWLVRLYSVPSHASGIRNATCYLFRWQRYVDGIFAAVRG